MSRGKQSVKKGVRYIGGTYKRSKKRKQKGGAFPFGLITSLAAHILGEVAKPILGRILGRGIKKEEEELEDVKKTYNIKKKSKSKSCKFARWKVLPLDGKE